MATPKLRTEYADKTLAMNAMIDRQLKIKISNLDAESSIYKRDLAREEKAIRQELNSGRRMSLNPAPRQNFKFNRRASSPLKCKAVDSTSGNSDKCSSSIQRLELPDQKSIRRRSLPDMDRFSLPALTGNLSLTSSRQFEEEKRDASKSRYRQGRRRSEIPGSLSQTHTPTISPRHSVSSLVSSLSNSTNQLNCLKNSEETFDKVRQFLQKLDESKFRNDSQNSEDSTDNCSSDDFGKAEDI